MLPVWICYKRTVCFSLILGLLEQGQILWGSVCTLHMFKNPFGSWKSSKAGQIGHCPGKIFNIWKATYKKGYYTMCDSNICTWGSSLVLVTLCTVERIPHVWSMGGGWSTIGNIHFSWKLFRNQTGIIRIKEGMKLGPKNVMLKLDRMNHRNLTFAVNRQRSLLLLQDEQMYWKYWSFKNIKYENIRKLYKSGYNFLKLHAYYREACGDRLLPEVKFICLIGHWFNRFMKATACSVVACARSSQSGAKSTMSTWSKATFLVKYCWWICGLNKHYGTFHIGRPY